MKSPTVYILANKPRSVLYIGVTSNLVQRIWQHREGLVHGFTKRYGSKMLVWYEQHPTMMSAIAREKALKKWLRRQKLELITKHNHQWRDLWPEIIHTREIVASASVTPATPVATTSASAVDPRLRQG